MMLSEAVPAFLEHKQFVRMVCAGSARTYGGHLRRFTAAVGLDTTLDEAAGLVEPYLIALGRRGRSDWYRAKAFRYLRDLYRWACDRGHAARNPLRDERSPRVHDTPKTFLTEPEVLRLLDTIRSSGKIHARRDHALMATLYYTWVRIGEGVRSRPEDYDLETCTIRVFGKGGKERLIPFDPQLAPILCAWLPLRPSESPYMFPSKAHNSATPGLLGVDRVERVLREVYAPLAGLAGRVTPHTLRRSGADHARKRGARLYDIQHVLRHEDLRTTMKYLSVPSPDELRGVWRKA